MCVMSEDSFGLKFNMEFSKLRTSKISICKKHIIQGPPVQLYRDNLRTHVPMCEDYLQKRKNSRNRKERQNGKLIQDPSDMYSEFIQPLCVLHSQFPTKKLWEVAYFWPPKKFFPKIFNLFLAFMLCNFLVRTLQHF